jgi:hypothetical protein
LCLPEEWLLSSGSVKAPLGMDLDSASHKAEVVSPVVYAAAAGTPVMPVASVAASPKAEAILLVDSAAASGSSVMPVAPIA